jgi:hypothetical protein
VAEEQNCLSGASADWSDEDGSYDFVEAEGEVGDAREESVDVCDRSGDDRE